MNEFNEPISLFDEAARGSSQDQSNPGQSNRGQATDRSYEDDALGLFDEVSASADEPQAQGRHFEAADFAADMTAEHPAVPVLVEAEAVNDSQAAEIAITSLAAAVANARSLPLSRRTALIKRDEVQALIAEIQMALPKDLAMARSIIAARDDMNEDARREVDRMIESARVEQSRLVSEHEVTRAAVAQAEETRRTLEAECERIRRETDSYVAAKLAAYEDSLTRALDVVQRGRTRFGGYVPVPGEEAPTEAAPISRIPRSA